jgi:hypothetical protein
MNPDLRLKDILIASKIADWYSINTIVDYDLDLSLGILFVEGKIVFYDGSILEFTESITPERFKYRYHYMNSNSELIFRYDNVPHHHDIATFPDHKHYPNAIVESQSVDLRQVVEEIIDLIVDVNQL